MAKDRNKKGAKKTKQEKKREQYMYFMAFLVIGTMLFSGLYYYGGSGGGGTSEQPKQEIPYFDAYEANQIPLNGSLLVTVDVVRPEVIAMVRSSCVNFQQVGWVYNISEPGLKSKVLSAVNPQKSPYYDLCGSFLYFRFVYDSPPGDVSGIDGKLRNTLGEYVLRRAYTALLPGNLSGPGTDKVYVIGSLDVKKGDKAMIILFQKATDGSVFGLEAKKLVKGPVIEGKVVAIDGILAEGSIPGDYSPEKIAQIANMSEASIYQPKVVVNAPVNGTALDELSGIPTVNVEAKDNTTIISYNNSLEAIKKALDGGNMTYSLENGSISLKIPLNTSVSKARDVLVGAGISGVSFKKDGVLSVPSDVLINDKAATIEDSDKFNALLDMKTGVGDTVNITLSALEFGDQVFIVGGSQTG